MQSIQNGLSQTFSQADFLIGSTNAIALPIQQLTAIRGRRHNNAPTQLQVSAPRNPLPPFPQDVIAAVSYSTIKSNTHHEGESAGNPRGVRAKTVARVWGLFVTGSIATQKQ